MQQLEQPWEPVPQPELLPPVPVPLLALLVVWVLPELRLELEPPVSLPERVLLELPLPAALEPLIQLCPT